MIDLEQRKRARAEVLNEIALDHAQHAETIANFHRAWYASKQTWGMTTFEGVPLLKNPMDLWVYQDIIWHLKPTLIIETGTALGGSALYFARQLDKQGVGSVISIDTEPNDDLPLHPRITYLKGWSSTDPQVVHAVRYTAIDHPRVMVVLDSDHSAAHVTAELDAYHDMVTEGQFIVVEDTNINGRPVESDWKGGPGPGPAVDAWLPQHPEFQVDPLAERYLLTMHPNGWLRRME